MSEQQRPGRELRQYAGLTETQMLTEIQKLVFAADKHGRSMPTPKMGIYYALILSGITNVLGDNGWATPPCEDHRQHEEDCGRR